MNIQKYKIFTTLMAGIASFSITAGDAWAKTTHNLNAGTVSVSALGAADGVASIFLDVRLKSEWQTYHKSPEDYDTHLKLIWPEHLEDKVSFYEIDWPPFITRDYYGSEIEVYKGQVLLPISVTFEDYDDVPEVLDFELEIFFCSNVCIRENLPMEVSL